MDARNFRCEEESAVSKRESFGAAASSQDFVQAREERKNFHRNRLWGPFVSWMKNGDKRDFINPVQPLGRQ